MRTLTKAGYTLVELIIVVALLVILVGAAAPRYNQFVQRQNFADSGQKLVECMQKGQQYASAPAYNVYYPELTARYSRVTLTLHDDATGTPTRCKVEALDSNRQLLYGTDAVYDLPGLIYTDMRVAAQGIQWTSPVELYFGSLEKGAPIELTSPSGTVIQSPTQPLGEGFNFSVVLEGTQASVRGNVTMGRLGVPIFLIVEP